MNQRERLRLREQGYQDGYAGRAAASRVAEYQRSWRRGREAYEAEHGAQPGQRRLPLHDSSVHDAP